MQFSLGVTIILVRCEGFKFSSRARMSAFSLFQIFFPRFLHFSSILFILLLGSLLTQSHTFSAIPSALFHIFISTFIPLYFSLTLRLIWDYSLTFLSWLSGRQPLQTLHHPHNHHQHGYHNHCSIHYIYFKGHVEATEPYWTLQTVTHTHTYTISIIIREYVPCPSVEKLVVFS